MPIGGFHSPVGSRSSGTSRQEDESKPEQSGLHDTAPTPRPSVEHETDPMSVPSQISPVSNLLFPHTGVSTGGETTFQSNRTQSSSCTDKNRIRYLNESAGSKQFKSKMATPFSTEHHEAALSVETSTAH